MSLVPGRQGTLNWMLFHPLCWGAGQRKLSYFACFLQSESMPWLFFWCTVNGSWTAGCFPATCTSCAWDCPLLPFSCCVFSYVHTFELFAAALLEAPNTGACERQMTRSCLLVGLSPQVAQAFLGFRWLVHFGGHQHSFTGPGLLLWLSSSGGGQRKLNMPVCFFYQNTC